MTDDSTFPLPLHPSMVLGAYCDALVGGKRVAVLGDSSTGLAERLAVAAGRRVHLFDPDAQRTATSIAQSPRGGGGRVRHAVLDDDRDLPTDAFDVVVVPDLSMFAEPATLVTVAHEMLSSRGVLVVASPNAPTETGDAAAPSRHRRPPSPAGTSLGYYDLYDVVAAEFSWVKMLGQAPFVGFTVADFAAEGEPAVTIDSSLTEAPEEPTWFVVVAATGGVELDPYLLVQLPTAAALPWLGAASTPAGGEGAAAALVDAKARGDALARDLEQLRERQQRDARLAEERRGAATVAAARAAELEATLHEQRRALDQARGRVAQLEQALATGDRRVLELEDGMAAAEERQSELEGAVRAHGEREAELEDALATIAEHEVELESELEALRARPSRPAPAAASSEDTAADAVTARAFEFQIAELRKTLAATRNERDALRVRADIADRLERELAVAELALAKAEARLVQLTGGEPDAEFAKTHADEVGRLEEALRERGRAVAELEQRLRESVCVGKELVRRLESAPPATVLAPPPSSGLGRSIAGVGAVDPASQAGGESPAGPVGPSGEVATLSSPDDGAHLAEIQGELELLAQKCTTYQADLEAARWTIQGLEHRLADVAEPDAPAIQKLEEALHSARLEVAQLRAELRDRGAAG